MQDAETKLGAIQVSTAGQMTLVEFASAMESVAPLANEKLWKRLAKETYKLHKSGSAPVGHLAGELRIVS